MCSPTTIFSSGVRLPIKSEFIRGNTEISVIASSSSHGCLIQELSLLKLRRILFLYSLFIMKKIWLPQSLSFQIRSSKMKGGLKGHYEAYLISSIEDIIFCILIQLIMEFWIYFEGRA